MAYPYGAPPGYGQMPQPGFPGGSPGMGRGVPMGYPGQPMGQPMGGIVGAGGWGQYRTSLTPPTLVLPFTSWSCTSAGVFS